MSSTEGKIAAPEVYWMSLAHPNGRLILVNNESRRQFAPYPSFEAHFHGVTRGQLIKITARSLAAEKRFSHQLRRPVSVLEHSNWLGEFFRQQGMDPLVPYAKVHDTPESFGHDIPKMMKSEATSKAEHAIYQAFKWGVPEPEGSDLELFKMWDGIAAAAEASLFGFAWPWINDYRTRFGSDKVDQYIMHLHDREDDDLDELQVLWREEVTEICFRNGLMEGELFAVSDDLLQRIQHK